MLIIKIKQEESPKDKRNIKIRRKKSWENRIDRENIKINNEIHTVVSLPASCCKTDEFERLLRVYKGKVITPINEDLHQITEDYLFDDKPYFKRAVLSAFVRYSDDDFNKSGTVCVEDSSFRITREYAELAKFARKLIILSEKDINTQEFSDYCLIHFGTVVSIKDSIELVDWDVYLNLDDMFDNGRVIVRYKDKDAVLYPDSDYFICNRDVNEIISYGIPVKTACAALEVRKNQELKWVYKNINI